MSVVTFKEESHFVVRNKTNKCLGVNIHSLAGVVSLAPVNSKGVEGDCKIFVPKEGTSEVVAALLKASNPKLKTCTFVQADELIPKAWQPWFWAVISSNAPFSWGDNNISLVTASDFARHCEEALDLAEPETSRSAITKFLNSLNALGETYINLEC